MDIRSQEREGIVGRQSIPLVVMSSVMNSVFYHSVAVAEMTGHCIAR